MYESFYGFTELPFELTANPKYLFLSSRHREALSTLEYGLFAAKSITLLIGEAGTGKTTLIRAALESERCRNVRCIYLNNPALGPEDFLRLLALKFKLGSDAAESKAVLLEQLGRGGASRFLDFFAVEPHDRRGPGFDRGFRGRNIGAGHDKRLELLRVRAAIRDGGCRRGLPGGKARH